MATTLVSGAGGYNEVILDVAHIEAHLPLAVDGFFYMDGHEAGRAKASRARNAFLADFPSATSPLIRFAPRNLASPFQVG